MAFERNSTHILSEHTVRTCAIMFSVGLVGNLLALAMLIRTAGRSCIGCSSRSGRTSSAFKAVFSSGSSGGGGTGRELGAFYTLVLALTVTDLLGTCLTSPVAITAYSRNLTVPALGGAALCTSMAAFMLFFGAATQGIVCAMAVERVLCISVPFAYAGSAHRDAAVRAALLLIFVAAALLGSAPLLGVADAVVYEPGTWCYVDMRPLGGRAGGGGANVTAFPLVYASIMATLTLVTVVCNACVMVTLSRMIKRKRVLQAAGPGGAAGARERRRRHRQEEDNLTVLVSITLMSLVCTTPLTVRAIVNAVSGQSNYRRDLHALRLHAFNPILDPWMYLLGRNSFFVRLRRFVRRLCGHWHASPRKVSHAAPGPHKSPEVTGAERGLVAERAERQVSERQYHEQQQSDPNHHQQQQQQDCTDQQQQLNAHHHHHQQEHMDQNQQQKDPNHHHHHEERDPNQHQQEQNTDQQQRQQDPNHHQNQQTAGAATIPSSADTVGGARSAWSCAAGATRAAAWRETTVASAAGTETGTELSPPAAVAMTGAATEGAALIFDARHHHHRQH